MATEIKSSARINPRSDANGLKEWKLNIGLATKWLGILSLGGIEKIRNRLVANPIKVRRTCSISGILFVRSITFYLYFIYILLSHALSTFLRP